MQITQPNVQGRRLSPEDVRTVAPALEAYTQYGQTGPGPVRVVPAAMHHHRRRIVDSGLPIECQHGRDEQQHGGGNEPVRHERSMIRM